MGKMSVIDWIAWVLLFVGGLNWGLIGLFDWNLVTAISAGTFATIVYVLVGLAALWSIYTISKN